MLPRFLSCFRRDEKDHCTPLMRAAEMGANEHGVVIGNEAVFTRTPVGPEGLLGMDLLRLGLERGADAEGAVEVITSLLEQHGQGGDAGLETPGFRYHNSFLVADPTSAYVVETVAREWRVERVTSGVRSISNGLTIPDFARRHSARLKTAAAEAVGRARRTACLAEEARTPAAMMRILRDHGPGRTAPKYRWTNGALSAPCAHGGGLLGATQTTASWVSWLGADAHAHWATGTAGPCTGLFKPVDVHQPVPLGPTPTDKADGASLWWRHEALHRRVMSDPVRLLPLYAEERDVVEARWCAARPDSVTAFEEGDRLLSQWVERVSRAAGRDRRPWWARRYWARRDTLAGPPIG